ncbi:MAG: type II toxin-antitoxin system VapC family toxin [Hormoscilla sp. SP5CHS1]|nr:type II toxin-antitoxin system VapC family toxin [Hormoscilla sp. SP5CHS1]
MRFLLDTNVLSELTRRVPNPFVRANIDRFADDLALPSVSLHEILYGALRLPEFRKRRAIFAQLDYIRATMPILPYDEPAATWHASERSRLSQIGLMPAFADGQIAAIAATRELILVTNNLRDFQYFDGLAI